MSSNKRIGAFFDTGNHKEIDDVIGNLHEI